MADYRNTAAVAAAGIVLVADAGDSPAADVAAAHSSLAVVADDNPAAAAAAGRSKADRFELAAAPREHSLAEPARDSTNKTYI